jgi:hypothetical protein
MINNLIIIGRKSDRINLKKKKNSKLDEHYYKEKEFLEEQ